MSRFSEDGHRRSGQGRPGNPERQVEMNMKQIIANIAPGAAMDALMKALPRVRQGARLASLAVPGIRALRSIVTNATQTVRREHRFSEPMKG